MPTQELNENLKHDRKGRILADDGLPAAGLASVAEVVTTTGLSRAQVYRMVNSGEVVIKRFGKSIRIPWSVVRSTFLGVDS